LQYHVFKKVLLNQSINQLINVFISGKEMLNVRLCLKTAVLMMSDMTSSRNDIAVLG